MGQSEQQRLEVDTTALANLHCAALTCAPPCLSGGALPPLMIALSQARPEIPDDVMRMIWQFIWRERVRAAKIIFHALQRWRYMVCFPYPPYVQPGPDASVARGRLDAEPKKAGLRLAMAYVAASRQASCYVITDVD